MFSFRRRTPRFSHRLAGRTLRLESLEGRQMMSANSDSYGDVEIVDFATLHSSTAALDSAPTLNPIADPAKTAAAGQTITFTVSVTDPGAGVSYRLFTADGFTAPADVDWTIEASSGLVSITPKLGFTGSLNLRVGVRSASADDTEANYDFESFTLAVSTPSIADVPDQTAQAGEAKTITITSTDPLGAAPVYDIVDPITLGVPQNVVIENLGNGQFKLTPAGDFTGVINLRARVRSTNSPAADANYDVDDFTLTVQANVTLTTPENVDVPGSKVVYVPLDGRDDTGNPIAYSAQSDNSGVELAVLYQNSASLVLNVEGVNASGQPFAGKIVLKLFEDLAPNTTAHIKNLVAQGAYNNKTFHRIIEGFMAQAGSGVSSATIKDEFHADLTFVSRGLLAMAHAGHDTGGGQFFITALNGNDSASPIPLAQMPEGLNYLHTIFGQLVEGAAVFNQLIATPTTGDAPNSAPKITSAQIITDAQNAVLRIKPKAGFTGTANITVTATGSGDADIQSFTATAVADNLTDRPFLGPVANQTTTAGTPVTVTIPSTNVDNVTLLHQIVATSGASDVTITQGATSNSFILTPREGFTGTINLQARVKNTNLADSTADIEAFTLTVNAAATKPTLGSVVNQQTTPGSPVTFTLVSTNQGSSGVVYSILDNDTDQPLAASKGTVAVNGGVVTVTPAAGFTGTMNLTARVRNSNAADAAENYDTKDFTLTVSTASTTKPTLGTVGPQTSSNGAAVSLTLTATNPTSGTLQYSIVDPATGAAPGNVTITPGSANGSFTLTPASGFTGTINLVARVKLSTDPDVAASYSTQSFTLAVTGTTPAAPTGLAMAAPTGGGAFDGNGYTSIMPTLTLTAPTGATVEIKRGSTVIATATETAAGSGQYRATLPAGTLAVGANTLTAVAKNSGGTSAESPALSVTYAPNVAGGVYTVPGSPGATQALTFAWTSKNAAYNNEFGYVVVSSADGSINGVAPGAANYAQAMLSSANRRVIFSQGQGAGASATINLAGGQSVVFYMIQNNTTANFLAKNAANAPRGNNNGSAPLAFFSVQAANPDGRKHVQIVADPTSGFAQYNWEDLYSLGDGDFNDAAITVRTASHAVANPGAIRAPGAAGNVNLNAALNGGTPVGDFGVYFVDNPNGAIGSLEPGDSGYAAAALAAANRNILYSAGINGNKQIAVPAGKYVAFYTISSGTTASFLTANSTNAANGSAVAFFSFDDANPDDANHFRWVSPGNQAADADFMQLHVMDKRGGGDGDFDSYTVSLNFSA